jgi:hypothetical protein
VKEGRTALEVAPVAWRILLGGVWTNCIDPELVARSRAAGYAVESLYSRAQLQDAYDDGYARAIQMVAEGE